MGAARPGVRARGAAREARLPLARRRARRVRRDAPARSRRRFLRRGDPHARAPRRPHRARRRGRAACGWGSKPSRSSSRRTAPRRRPWSARSSRRTATSSTRSSGSRIWAPATPSSRSSTAASPRCASSAASPSGSGPRRRRSRPSPASGAGAVLLAGFIAAWLENATPEDALRRAVATGAASTLSVGAGRFDPRGRPAAAAGRPRGRAHGRRQRIGSAQRCYRSYALGGPGAYGSRASAGSRGCWRSRRSSRGRASRLTTSCSSRRSRTSCRTTWPRRRASRARSSCAIPVVSAAMDTVTEAANGDRARAHGRHRRRPPKPLDRRPGGRGRQGQALGVGHDRRARDARAGCAAWPTRSS